MYNNVLMYNVSYVEELGKINVRLLVMQNLALNSGLAVFN